MRNKSYEENAVNSMEKMPICELITLLDQQDILRIPQNILALARTAEKKEHWEFYMICWLYRYGYIIGQRSERARRKRGADA